MYLYTPKPSPVKYKKHKTPIDKQMKWLAKLTLPTPTKSANNSSTNKYIFFNHSTPYTISNVQKNLN